MTDEVLEYVEEHGPIEQDEIEDEFGRRGLRSLKVLMARGDVSYTVDWKIQRDREKYE